VAHGYPDYGTQGPISTVHSVQDMGELAARLKSIDTFDRRGNVIWLDDFESGIQKWRELGAGFGADFVWTTARSRNGSYSGKLITGVAIGNSGHIEHYQPYPVLSKMGLEVSFAKGDNWDDFYIRFFLYDGAFLHEVQFHWESADNCLYYLPQAGAEIQLLPAVPLYVSDYMFNTFKVVADFVNNEYVRFIANERTFDLAGIPHRLTGMITIPFIACVITLYTNANASAIAYIDDVIITQNET